MKEKAHSFITQLNESVNLLAFGLVLVSLCEPKDLANQLIIGAIGLMGGKALNQAATARRAADFPKENTDAKTDSGNPADPAARDAV